jgi:hypothetical protein
MMHNVNFPIHLLVLGYAGEYLYRKKYANLLYGEVWALSLATSAQTVPGLKKIILFPYL